MWAAADWRRHPADVARLVFAGVVLAVALASAAAIPGALTNVSADIVRLVGRIPASLRDLLIGATQLAIVAGPIVLVVWAARWRRPRQLVVVAVGGLLAIGLMASLVDWLERVAPPELLALDPQRSWIAQSDFPSVSSVAGLTAVVTIVVPATGPSWRRVGWSVIALAALVQTMTATQVPVNVLVAIVLGVFVGSAVLVVAGAPVRQPGRARLGEALSSMRLDLDEVGDAVSVDGRRAWQARTGDGGLVRLVYIGADERDANLLFRMWRRIRVKGIEDESPEITPRALARNEALVTLLADARGVAVPQVLGVDEGDDGSAVLALDLDDVPALSALPPDRIDDVLLRDVWAQTERLHRAGIAHRRLRPAHVLISDTPVITGLGWGRIDATDAQLSTDVAELLVGTALLVGPERAAAAAAAVVDRQQLVRAMAYVQPLALSAETRRAAKEVDGLLDAVRAELQRLTGSDEPELQPLARLTVAGVVTGVGLFVLVGFGLGLAANFGDIVDAVREAEWAYLPWILLATVMTYVAGAISLSGSVLRPLGLTETTTVMLGQSFLNRFTPANAGGMAMRIRYLQKGGTELAVATAAVGLTSAASGVAQVALVAVFFTWSGSTPGGGDTTPVDGTAIALVFLAVVAVVGIVVGVPWLRATVGGWVQRSWSKLRGEYGELARRPAKLAQLFGGAALGKLANIVAFALACRSFGIDLGFAELGALYLVSTTVAGAVPTPGGVGAIEAALVFVLTGAGVDEPVAWSATLVFRLVTYWLPTLPGWLALRHSERAELV